LKAAVNDMMPHIQRFHYQGISEAGEKTKGYIQARNAASAKIQLRKKVSMLKK
jgi:type II secretory pathway component PulF